MSSKQKNAERIERKQQKIDAGRVSACFPDVASIVITMNYYQKGSVIALMQRTVNFFPGSAAYFLMECMGHDCLDGGFDLGPAVNTMVKRRLKSADGKLVCSGSNSSGHTWIDYQVAIEYSDTAE